MVGAGSCVFAVWGYCISKADPDNHTVRLHPAVLATAIGDPREQIDNAIGYLCDPDKKSTNTDHDGRRLIHMTGYTYEVVSHGHYRNIKTAADKKAYERDRKRNYRAKTKDENECPDIVPTCPGQNGTPASVSVSVSEKGESEREEKKTAYGEFKGVKLTETEYTRLVGKHGESRLEKGIEVLDDYMRAKGKRYKDHYAVLKETSWVWTRVDETCGKQKNKSNI